MATKVLMEALSPTMEEGRLVEWKKQEGDTVAAGDVLAEVETDKAVMDLVARVGGTLLKQVIAAGTTVPVSALVGVIGKPGEDVAGLLGGQGGSGAAAPKSAATPAVTSATPAAPTVPTSSATPASTAASASSRPPQGLAAGPQGRHRPRHRPPGAPGLGARGPHRAPRPGHGRPDGGVAGLRPPGLPPFRRRLHRRPAHPDPEDHRQAAGALHRPGPDLLPHDRGRHGAGLGGARGAQGAGAGRQDLLQRHHHEGDRPGAAAAPRLQRLVAGRPDPLLERGARQHGGGGRGRPDHAGDPARRPQVAAPDRGRVEGPGRPGAGAEAQAGGVHRRHLLGFQSRHVRHRPVHRDHQSARGRHPGRRARSWRSRSWRTAP